MAQPIRVLSIDGGGIRGIIPAVVLTELERRTGKPIASLFDLIAGTSAGGIIALGLTRPDARKKPVYTAADTVDFFEEEGLRIFSRSLFHTVNSVDGLLTAKYPSEGIDKVLHKYFGSTYLDEAITPVLVTAYEIERRAAFFFKSHKAKINEARNFLMREVARATSAAPTYFDPVQIKTKDVRDYYALIDGGVYASNPAMCAYVEAKAMFPTADCIVVSLGTGVHTRPLRFTDACGWGKSRWAQPILDIVFDGISDTVHHQLKLLLPVEKQLTRYYRLQAHLEKGDDDLDNTSRENIRILKLMAEEIIQQQDEVLSGLAKQLAGE